MHYIVDLISSCAEFNEFMPIINLQFFDLFTSFKIEFEISFFGKFLLSIILGNPL